MRRRAFSFLAIALLAAGCYQQAQDDFLELSGVAAISGTSFGKMGEGYIRFSYANSLDKIEDAMERIKKLLLK